jgi:hypothetical protein
MAGHLLKVTGVRAVFKQVGGKTVPESSDNFKRNML